MKEQAIISYIKGISNSPSDFICEDGTLAECVNMEVKDQELIPMQMPVKLPFSMGDGERILHIHNIPNSPLKNYIYTDNNNNLMAFHLIDGRKHDYSLSVPVGNVNSVETLGNTLLVYSEDCIHYILFSGSSYNYLGNKLPNISISFNLTGEFVVQEDEESQVTTEPQRVDEVDEDLLKGKTELYKAATNKFIQEKATSEGKFMYPFFVRYALTLANGEHVCHSSPVLMLPSSFRSPYIMQKSVEVKDNIITTEFVVGGYVASLQYRINDTDTLSDWSDVIRGIDIYVSKQTWTYDQSYSGTEFDNSHNFYEWFIGEVTNVQDFSSSLFSPTQQGSGHKKIEDIGDLYNIKNNGYYFGVRGYSETEIKDKLIENSAVFYKYLTIPVSNVTPSSSYVTIDPSDSSVATLSTIEQYETLTDDYMTNDSLVPSFTNVYNGRLNMANIKRVLFEGYKAESMFQSLDDNQSLLCKYDAYVYVTTSNGDVKIVKASGNVGCQLLSGMVFYPDTDAYLMVLYDKTSTSPRTTRIPLVEHPGLNGSYGLIMNAPSSWPFISNLPYIEESEDPYDYMENKLFTSDVNNPFFFPLAGINTVGNSKILGLSAMTRPISQGQFGDYPLVAFCSDGNYALKVDVDGFYSGVSPIQEDIVINDDKITSLEDSIVIVTQKGLMLTTGGEITRLAPQMDGSPFDSETLDNIASVDDGFELLFSSAKDSNGFMTFLRGARIAYDYSLNRILIYNPEKKYSYLYNFDNASVAKVVLDGGGKIVNAVSDYPDTIIQSDNGSLYSLYTKEDISEKEGHSKGLIITRPLKFGAVMNLKSLYRLKNIHSGLDKDSFVKYRVYGSNDNVKYYPVSSRFGKPYKFYRMVIYTNLLSKEVLSGTVVEYEKRRTNKIR